MICAFRSGLGGAATSVAACGKICLLTEPPNKDRDEKWRLLGAKDCKGGAVVVLGCHESFFRGTIRVFWGF